ncbi:MAG: galactose mutarotase, partial [Nocardioides sp.]|nr:galactose mutarotase [Nocardioides sp.]
DAGATAQMSLVRTPWGTAPDGSAVERLIIGSREVRLGLLTWGATAHTLEAGDTDVLLGFDSLDGYLAGHPFIGATVGRYANRIAGGRFTLDGRTHQIPLNDGENALHGGPDNFGLRNWSLADTAEDGVRLELVSPDGDMGFPGRLSVTLDVTVSGPTVRWETRATTDAPTVVNLTNHAYFHLGGPAAWADTIADHTLRVPAQTYVAVDDAAIPLPGGPAPVTGTVFDLRAGVRIGDRLDPSAPLGDGIDHTLVLAAAPGELREAAVVTLGERRLVVRTTEPGVQVYTGNFLDGTLEGKGGHKLAHRAGVCLETQAFPDSPNRPDFPSTVLRPGEEYHSVTEWQLT